MTIATSPLSGESGVAEPKPVPPVLDRRFEAVVFDWDGTAVPDRRLRCFRGPCCRSRICAPQEWMSPW